MAARTAAGRSRHRPLPPHQPGGDDRPRLDGTRRALRQRRCLRRPPGLRHRPARSPARERRATGSASSPSRTGAIPQRCGSWAGPGCSRRSPPGPWIPWSTTTPPRRRSATTTPTPPVAAPGRAPTGRPSPTPLRSRARSRDCRRSSAASRRASEGWPTTTTGTTGCAARCWSTARPTCSCTAWRKPPCWK